MNTQIKGLKGEEVAARFLEACGFKVLERRYRFGHKEIDIVAMRDNLVIFVEVKRRLNEKFGDIRTSIDSRKRQNLVRAAQGWLYQHGTTNSERSYRFDVILLYPPDRQGKVRLEHIEDAFRP